MQNIYTRTNAGEPKITLMKIDTHFRPVYPNLSKIAKFPLNLSASAKSVKYMLQKWDCVIGPLE